jgi:hypothetical protein
MRAENETLERAVEFKRKPRRHGVKWSTYM